MDVVLKVEHHLTEKTEKGIQDGPNDLTPKRIKSTTLDQKPESAVKIKYDFVGEVYYNGNKKERRFVVGDKLGAGAFGDVFLGYDQ